MKKLTLIPLGTDNDFPAIVVAFDTSEFTREVFLAISERPDGSLVALKTDGLAITTLLNLCGVYHPAKGLWEKL